MVPKIRVPRFRHLRPSIALALGLTLPAQAADPLRACSTAHEQAQELRLKGQLLVATEVLRACVRESCPLEIRNECRALGAAIDRAQPSVVLRAVAADGSEARGARVEIDGDESGVSIDGRAIALDPGRHRFRFVLADGQQRTLEAELREADKSRQVLADFREPAGALGLSEGSDSRVLAYVAGGVGVVALGLFSYFALSGNAQRDELRECEPNCTRSGVDTMRTRYLLADLSLGLSVLSLGTATYLFFQPSIPSGAPEPGAGTSALPHTRAGLSLSIGGSY